MRYSTMDWNDYSFECYEETTDDDGGSWRCLAVFRGTELDDDDIEYLNRRRFGRYYGGPGRSFSHGWYFYRQNSRVVGRCSGGLDV